MSLSIKRLGIAGNQQTPLGKESVSDTDHYELTDHDLLLASGGEDGPRIPGFWEIVANVSFFGVGTAAVTIYNWGRDTGASC